MKMSKVNLEFDTETNAVVVSLDGATIDNVKSFCLYLYHHSAPSVGIEIEEDMGGFMKRSYLSNSQLSVSKASKYNGLYQSDVDPKYADACSKLLNRNKF